MPGKDPVWLEIFKQELRTTSSSLKTTRISIMDKAEPPRSKNYPLPSNFPQTSTMVELAMSSTKKKLI
jgi:hypothetical protein